MATVHFPTRDPEKHLTEEEMADAMRPQEESATSGFRNFLLGIGLPLDVIDLMNPQVEFEVFASADHNDDRIATKLRTVDADSLPLDDSQKEAIQSQAGVMSELFNMWWIDVNKAQ